jgi:hypothetical protein
MSARFFHFCSGASPELLAQCPQCEKIKYACIGGTVFFTALLAWCSGGYAMYSIFESSPNALLYAIGFGLVWALMIFNLDRFIVSSMRKEGSLKKQMLFALPRIVLAIFISLIIAKPLEIKIFADRLEQQIYDNKLSKLNDNRALIDSINNLSGLTNEANSLDNQLVNLQNKQTQEPDTREYADTKNNQVSEEQNLAKLRVSLEPKIQALENRRDGIRQDLGNYHLNAAGVREINTDASRELNELAAQKAGYNTQINTQQKEVDRYRKIVAQIAKDYYQANAVLIEDNQREQERNRDDKAQADSVAGSQTDQGSQAAKHAYTENLITQIEALGSLYQNSSSTVWWAGTLLQFLFICIETAPVFVKLLSKRGPYDELLDKVEHECLIEQRKKISDLNEQVNDSLENSKSMGRLNVESRLQAEKDRLDTELKSNQDLLDRIAEKQGLLAEKMIDKWYKEELEKIES